MMLNAQSLHVKFILHKHANNNKVIRVYVVNNLHLLLMIQLQLSCKINSYYTLDIHSVYKLRTMHYYYNNHLRDSY